MIRIGERKAFSKNPTLIPNMEDHIEYSRNTLMDFIKLKPKDIEICDVALRDGGRVGDGFSRNITHYPARSCA
ncbi:MAG: hypothetical protein KAV00_04005, partial [Phycisphaerae bacterium]|nr:hypothetical protein [Phycisphaerae bacterium]